MSSRWTERGVTEFAYCAIGPSSDQLSGDQSEGLDWTIGRLPALRGGKLGAMAKASDGLTSEIAAAILQK
jgi:hypothetical protein